MADRRAPQMSEETPESPNRIVEFFANIRDQIDEGLSAQQWYQELKQKWEELDPQSKNAIQLGAAGLLAIFFVVLTVTYSWGVASLRRDAQERSQLLSTLRGANEEMRKLRESVPPASSRGTGPWNAYFQSQAAAQGIDAQALVVSDPKEASQPAAGPANAGLAKEAAYDLTLRHVNIKQLVRFAFAIERGARPVKLRQLVVSAPGWVTAETPPGAADPAAFSGFLDAVYSVSAYSLPEAK